MEVDVLGKDMDQLLVDVEDSVDLQKENGRLLNKVELVSLICLSSVNFFSGRSIETRAAVESSCYESVL